MSNIKELTWEHHKNAERQGFVKVLLSGKINPKLYATFLWNQYLKYKELESKADEFGLFDGIEAAKRTQAINKDFTELWKSSKTPITLDSTLDYIYYIRALTNPDDVFAHIYVHHMGDLSGGQMIAKRIPGNGTMYQFDGDKEELKNVIRSRTTDEMAEQARTCFQYAIKTFAEVDKTPYPKFL